MKNRKLITPGALRKLYSQVILGVPMKRAMNNLDINGISLPSAKNLVDAYNEWLTTSDSCIKYSLFPFWLERNNGSLVQEQPSNWKYINKFPKGKWVCIDE